MPIYRESTAKELPTSVKRESKPVTGLEALTGADLAVSPPGVALPDRLDESLHSRAAIGRCYLVQYKKGLDLPSSVGWRLTSSLARMREWTPRQAQRVLLVCGILTIKNTKATVDGRRAKQEFWSVWAAVKKWCDRGGAVWPFVSKESLVIESLVMAERHLKKYQDEPVKEAWPVTRWLTETDENDPLQLVHVVKDARALLATLPGVGSQRAGTIWEYCEESGALALTQLTNYAFLGLKGRPRGFGWVIVRNCREFLGIPDGFNMYIMLDVPGEEKEP